jgi:hypothetical protein
MSPGTITHVDGQYLPALSYDALIALWNRAMGMGREAVGYELKLRLIQACHTDSVIM